MLVNVLHKYMLVGVLHKDQRQWNQVTVTPACNSSYQLLRNCSHTRCFPSFISSECVYWWRVKQCLLMVTTEDTENRMLQECYTVHRILHWKTVNRLLHVSHFEWSDKWQCKYSRSWSVGETSSDQQDGGSSAKSNRSVQQEVRTMNLLSHLGFFCVAHWEMFSK